VPVLRLHYCSHALEHSSPSNVSIDACCGQIDRERGKAMLTGKIQFGYRKALVSAALITLGFAGVASTADARRTPRDEGRQTYRMVGELSSEDVMALWPPARRTVRTGNEARASGSTRRFYRAYRSTAAVPLGDWVPEEGMSFGGARLRADEEKMKLQKDARDRDGDGTPDKQDVYPWDATRW
jgi:hypothetical protein